MHDLLAESHSHIWRFVLYLTACLFACGFGYSQEVGNPPILPAQSAEKEELTTLRGCVIGVPGRFFIAADEHSDPYRLTGDTSPLSKYVYKEVSVEGKWLETAPLVRSFEVTAVKEVFETPPPTLDPSYSNSSAWLTEKDETFGIRSRHPESFSRIPASGLTWLSPSFVTDQKVVTLSSFVIPRQVYPDTNFVGGFFAIFVNPDISNSPSCSQFGVHDPGLVSSYVTGKIEYAVMLEGGAAAGTHSSSHHFHTFQNGLCYEIAIGTAGFSTSNVDSGCKIPAVRRADEMKLIEPLMTQVSFFRPTTFHARPSKPQGVPRVTHFAASSQTAEDPTNRRQITFSWTTQNADYVQLSYVCNPPPAGFGVVISEGGRSRHCENDSHPIYRRIIPNHPPDASWTVRFQNYLRPHLISITVTVTPFSRAEAYAGSSRSITIQVTPYNRFPEGVPAPKGGLVIDYPARADGTSMLQQGSSLTIRWMEGETRSCINLYLVQDNENGGQTYRFRLGGKCFSPSSSGSFTWTIPDYFLGSGYRVFAMTPRGTFSALGAPFSIVSAVDH